LNGGAASRGTIAVGYCVGNYLRINPFTQLSGALEGYNLALIQQQIIPCGGITTAPFALIFNAKFTKPADQNIFAVLQIPFDDFNQPLDDFSALVFRKWKFFMNDIDDLGFGQGHDPTAPL